ncbi:MAG: aminotransferase class I/II-fold pyridoxal phosphate-dependent enzyme [Peptococcaceae bacterium]|nr:aminotransferase class I/II-fold pyridoxal phosphate-dependent enzyme [Peptococcaceae bacterium]
MEYYSQKAAGITPYTPGERPVKPLVRINTNENPYPPSPDALAAACGVAALRLYSDPDAMEVRQAVVSAEKATGVALGAENVFVGNGSDDVLSMCYQAFFPPVGAEDKPLLIPDISYSFYPVFANLYGVAYQEEPLDEKFAVVSAGYLRPNAGVVFANPNAPTGIYKPLEEIVPILEYCLHRSVVVVDEAYIAFGGVSAATLLSRFPNLLVVRTLSKSHALAGLRVGYALGHPDLIEGLKRIKDSVNPYAVDYIAQKTAAAALRDVAYCAGITARILATRERVAQRLREMGFEVLPSSTNFLFVTHEGVDARRLYEGLADGGIWVRYFDMPRIKNFIRVSVGTDEEMDVFLERLARLLVPYGREASKKNKKIHILNTES